jgi:trk system potassium uptake protein TrkH
MTIFFIMVAFAFFGGCFICATSGFSFSDAMYETVSALATVGLSAGGSGNLGVAGKLLIIMYMYFGRVGVLTLSLGFLMGDKAEERFRYAETNLLIG